MHIKLRLAATLLAAGALCAPLAHAETLSDIYVLARGHDPRFLSARAEFEASGFAVKEARAALLPNVGYQFGRVKTTQDIVRSENPVFAAGRTDYPTKEHVLSISQPIFRLGAWRGWKQSQAAERQAGAAYAAAEQDLIVRTATAYMAVLAANDALALARGETEAIKRQLDLAEARYKNGQAIKGSVYDAQARYALKESDVIAAENDLADKLQAVRELTGAAPGILQPLREGQAMPAPDPLEPEAWVALALRQNLLLQARQEAVDVARQEIERRKAGYYPTLDLSLSRNRRDTGGSLFGGGSNVNTTEVGIRLNVPLYEGGATSAQTGIALKRFEVAEQDLEHDRRQVERQARAAFRGVVSGRVRMEALDQSVRAFDSARQLKDEGYKAGVATVLAVLDAERDLYAARRDQAQSRYDVALNILRLRQSAGTLSEEDLRLVTATAR